MFSTICLFGPNSSAGDLILYHRRWIVSFQLQVNIFSEVAPPDGFTWRFMQMHQASPDFSSNQLISWELDESPSVSRANRCRPSRPYTHHDLVRGRLFAVPNENTWLEAHFANLHCCLEGTQIMWRLQISTKIQ